MTTAVYYTRRWRGKAVRLGHGWRIPIAATSSICA